jgi:hypothetical protein
VVPYGKRFPKEGAELAAAILERVIAPSEIYTGIPGQQASNIRLRLGSDGGFAK